jgi:hypothetical protein
MMSFNINNISSYKIPKTSYTISPWFAEIFGAKQIETEQLCRVLGYDAKMLKQLVSKAKQKNYSITFLGYGGTGVNTMHWLTEIMTLTNSVNLFDFVNVVEPDNIEFSNLLRFPKNPTKVNYRYHSGSNTSKLALIEPIEQQLLSKNKFNTYTNYVSNDNRVLSNYKGFYYNYSTGTTTALKNHIVYGAPSLDTRDLFSKVGNFIAATHSGAGCQLWLNPTQDTDLQIESYGLIALTPFFMNQLRMAIGLLEIMASGTDIAQKDVNTLSYSFDGVAKLPTNKIYNFHTDHTHTGLVQT